MFLQIHGESTLCLPFITVPSLTYPIAAAALFVTTSSQSDATINITVSAGNTSIDQQFQPPLSTITVVNLIEDEVTTFSITFINGTRLDVGTLIAQVSDDSSWVCEQCCPFFH